MRILLAHSFYRVPGGEDRYVSSQVELLSTRHEVDLLGARNMDLAYRARTGARMVFSAPRVHEVEARIRRFQPDLIHLHNPYPALGPAVHIAAKRHKLPLFVTVHNLRLRCPNGLMYTQGSPCRRCEAGNYVNAIAHRCFPSPSQSAAYAVALWVHRFLLRLEDSVRIFIAPSVFMHDRLVQWGISQERVAVVPNFVSQGDGAASVDPGARGIYVGRLSAEKGVDVLLRALSVAGDPPFQIVGEGPHQHELRTLAHQLGLTRTVFSGWLSSPEVADAVSKARYLVMPSLCEENAPIAVLEAMARGRPVIVSRRGGLPELVQRGGGLVSEAGDNRKLAANIRILISDDGLCSRLGAEALATAKERFSPEAHLSLLEQLYNVASSDDRALGQKRSNGTAARHGRAAD